MEKTGQDAQFVLLVADGTVSIGGGKQRRAALRRWTRIARTAPSASQFGEGTTTALQIDEGAARCCRNLATRPAA